MEMIKGEKRETATARQWLGAKLQTAPAFCSAYRPSSELCRLIMESDERAREGKCLMIEAEQPVAIIRVIIWQFGHVYFVHVARCRS